MAVLSSHFLDGTNGTHAAAVGVTLVHIDVAEGRQTVFSAFSDDGGRFTHDVDAIAGGKYEMLIASGAYFEGQLLPRDSAQILEEIVIRFTMPDPEARYHIPVIISPNSYSCWWSS
jgi:5-hydroxyisourate hydrolase